VVHEDEHLLAVAKPAGVTTHRADAHTQDGMHEWVQRQRPDVSLSVLHRLDKATSGVLVFGKTTAANRALTAQLTERAVAKTYELLTAPGRGADGVVRVDRPIAGAPAVTELERQATGPGGHRYEARPHTGRTHQVRIHAAAAGVPVVGDAEHGGPPGARLFLHAAAMGLTHPDGRALRLARRRPASFDRLLAGDLAAVSPALHAVVAHEARAALLDPTDTDAHLWIDRHHDGLPQARVERLGQVARVLDYRDATGPLPDGWLDALHQALPLSGVYVQHRPRRGGGGPAVRVAGDAAPRFEVVELGLRYLVDLEASATSSGIFLDQRETRRELLASDLAGRTVLNAFAHTGSLSVAAARAGAETLTLDLSKRYLAWAEENLRLNGIDPADHDAIYGDALEWMGRLARKGRRFDVVLVDPPSSSTGKGSGRWSVERDLGALVERAVTLCTPGGTVYVSTNMHRLTWPRVLGHVDAGLAAAGRSATVETRTLPLDHRSGPGDPPYLKAAWLHLDP
jgi:23S rRNA (cytosine1962-C5)-methyltransferase